MALKKRISTREEWAVLPHGHGPCLLCGEANATNAPPNSMPADCLILVGVGTVHSVGVVVTTHQAHRRPFAVESGAVE